MEVSPSEGNEWLVIPFARWIMRTFFHGDMKHSLKPFTAIVSVLSVVGAYFTFGRMYLEPGFITTLENNTVNVYVWLAETLGFMLAASFSWGVIGIASRTTCPECHQKFMFTRKRRFITGQGTHRGNEVTNYKAHWSCDNPDCGYEERNVSEIREREIQSEE